MSASVMPILDRYLLRQYCQVLLICFCSLVGLYAVIDALGHLDQFTRYADQTDTSVLAVIGRFYAIQSLGVFDRTSGILAMTAAMFTMAWFKRNNELTAMMAAGIGPFRAATPLLVAAGAISIFAAGSREVVLPALRSELLRTTNDLADTTERQLRPWNDLETRIELRGETTDIHERKIFLPVLRLPASLAVGTEEISAASARYEEATDLHPAGFRFLNVRSGTSILQVPSVATNGRVILHTPADSEWLGDDECFWPTGVTFDQIAAGPNWREYASTAELVHYLKRPTRDEPRAAYVALHGRLVRPILDASLVVIGLPLILSRRGRSPFLAVAMAMGLVTAFLLVALTCDFLGKFGWISPSLAAWLPLFLFVPLAVAASSTLRQ